MILFYDTRDPGAERQVFVEKSLQQVFAEQVFRHICLRKSVAQTLDRRKVHERAQNAAYDQQDQRHDRDRIYPAQNLVDDLENFQSDQFFQKEFHDQHDNDDHDPQSQTDARF